MHVAVQTVQDRIVSRPETVVVRQTDHLNPGISERGSRQLFPASVGTGVVHHIEPEIRAGGMGQNAAHGSAHLIIIAIRHNAGADLCHKFSLPAGRVHNGLQLPQVIGGVLINVIVQPVGI